MSTWDQIDSPYSNSALLGKIVIRTTASGSGIGELQPRNVLRLKARYREGTEHSENYIRAQIDDETIAVCFFNGIYPRFGDSVGKLVEFLGQHLHSES